VQLSILIPSHRHDLLTCSRIAQACSWASPEIEVLVRDNSGDPQKRALLPQFNRENCTILLAEPCDALSNIAELLARAKGEYVYVVADDDFCFDHAIAALPGLIAQHAGNNSVIGISGIYVVEGSANSAMFEYKDIDSDDVLLRLAGYLSNFGPNVLAYSPVRRELWLRVFSFIRSMPGLLSFHDQVASLLYLLNGKFVRLNRLMYLYEHGPWQNPITAQQEDIRFARSAGLDASICMLQWFICGFEGAVLVRNADELFPDYPLALRQVIADRWFAMMFARLKSDNRIAPGAKYATEGAALRARLLVSTGQLSFQDMLAELCGFMALGSPDVAQRYSNFWTAVINRRARASRPATAAPVCV